MKKILDRYTNEVNALNVVNRSKTMKMATAAAAEIKDQVENNQIKKDSTSTSASASQTSTSSSSSSSSSIPKNADRDDQEEK